MSQEPLELFGISLRDIILGIVGLLMSLMGWIFKRQDKRIEALENNKMDAKVCDDKFDTIIDRLDRQDTAAENRDKKLDRLIERLIPGERHGT